MASERPEESLSAKTTEDRIPRLVEGVVKSHSDSLTLKGIARQYRKSCRLTQSTTRTEIERSFKRMRHTELLDAIESITAAEKGKETHLQFPIVKLVSKVQWSKLEAALNKKPQSELTNDLFKDLILAGPDAVLSAAKQIRRRKRALRKSQQADREPSAERELSAEPSTEPELKNVTRMYSIYDANRQPSRKNRDQASSGLDSKKRKREESSSGEADLKPESASNSRLATPEQSKLHKKRKRDDQVSSSKKRKRQSSVQDPPEQQNHSDDAPSEPVNEPVAIEHSVERVSTALGDDDDNINAEEIASRFRQISASVSPPSSPAKERVQVTNDNREQAYQLDNRPEKSPHHEVLANNSNLELSRTKTSSLPNENLQRQPSSTEQASQQSNLVTYPNLEQLHSQASFCSNENLERQSSPVRQAFRKAKEDVHARMARERLDRVADKQSQSVHHEHPRSPEPRLRGTPAGRDEEHMQTPKAGSTKTPEQDSLPTPVSQIDSQRGDSHSHMTPEGSGLPNYGIQLPCTNSLDDANSSGKCGNEQPSEAAAEKEQAVRRSTEENRDASTPANRGGNIRRQRTSTLSFPVGSAHDEGNFSPETQGSATNQKAREHNAVLDHSAQSSVDLEDADPRGEAASTQHIATAEGDAGSPPPAVTIDQNTAQKAQSRQHAEQTVLDTEMEKARVSKIAQQDSTESKSSGTPKAVTKKKNTGMKSSFFKDTDTASPKKNVPAAPKNGGTPSPSKVATKVKRVPGMSCITMPALTNSRFGIVQEEYCDQPMFLLIATMLLNQTTGRAAIPKLFELAEKYPTPEALAAATIDDIHKIVAPLGLQWIRAGRILKLAETWVKDPPRREKRYRTLHYPKHGDGRDIKNKEVVGPEESDDRKGAWEIVHLPGVGPYAIDSWRIFCRDKLRGVADDWNGKNAKPVKLGYHQRKEGAEGMVEECELQLPFEPEWKRVVPQDKELRAFLKWLWLKEGWEWDELTGRRRKASQEKIDRVNRGAEEVEVTSNGGLMGTIVPQSQEFILVEEGQTDMDPSADTSKSKPSDSVKSPVPNEPAFLGHRPQGTGVEGPATELEVCDENLSQPLLPPNKADREQARDMQMLRGEEQPVNKPFKLTDPRRKGPEAQVEPDLQHDTRSRLQKSEGSGLVNASNEGNALVECEVEQEQDRRAFSVTTGSPEPRVYTTAPSSRHSEQGFRPDENKVAEPHSTIETCEPDTVHPPKDKTAEPIDSSPDIPEQIQTPTTPNRRHRAQSRGRKTPSNPQFSSKRFSFKTPDRQRALPQEMPTPLASLIPSCDVIPQHLLGYHGAKYLALQACEMRSPSPEPATQLSEPAARPGKLKTPQKRTSSTTQRRKPQKREDKMEEEDSGYKSHMGSHRARLARTPPRTRGRESLRNQDPESSQAAKIRLHTPERQRLRQLSLTSDENHYTSRSPSSSAQTPTTMIQYERATPESLRESDSDCKTELPVQSIPESPPPRKHTPPKPLEPPSAKSTKIIHNMRPMPEDAFVPSFFRQAILGTQSPKMPKTPSSGGKLRPTDKLVERKKSEASNKYFMQRLKTSRDVGGFVGSSQDQENVPVPAREGNGRVMGPPMASVENRHLRESSHATEVSTSNDRAMLARAHRERTGLGGRSFADDVVYYSGMRE